MPGTGRYIGQFRLINSDVDYAIYIDKSKTPSLGHSTPSSLIRAEHFFSFQVNTVQVPAEDIPFRLLGYVSQEVIFATTSYPYGGTTSSTEEEPNEFFTIVLGTGHRQGKYAFKNKENGRFLSSHLDDQSMPIDSNGHSDHGEQS